MRTTTMRSRAALSLLLLSAPGCASSERAFGLRDPLRVDTDLRSVSVTCHKSPTDKDPAHVSCSPDEYKSPLIWDGADNLFFRPFAEAWSFRAPTEAGNANAFDEVADSSWFDNRLGVRPVPIEELTRGACKPSQILDADAAADGSWVVDRGKTDGSSLGFRVNIAGKKYLFKVDSEAAERSSAASTIGAAAYAAVGFKTSCEQVVFFRPSLLKLKPGLRYKSNFGGEREFDHAALDHMLSIAPHRDGKVGFQASAWLPGKLLGPFRYEGTRPDDPNDVIDHADRRELRGGRLLAAWLDHFDAREQNSMDSWFSDNKDVPDGSPGHVVHYYLDTSDCLGSSWDWEEITRRLGYSYVADWADIGRDFVTLGIPLRPWDRVKKAPGREVFNYFDVANFEPDAWKNEYPNPAFDRMTERDGAWMARILSGFSPDMVRALAAMGRFKDPADTEYVAQVLQGRLDKILERYLLRLSPLSDVRVSGDALCATDLAERHGMRSADAFRYTARQMGSGWLTVTRYAGGDVCVPLGHASVSASEPDDSLARYVRIVMADGVARGPLVAHLYDLGASRGFKLVGLERPDEQGR